jgi:hypothetical protein
LHDTGLPIVFIHQDVRKSSGMNQQIVQAYRQAPWRVQLQWIGVFLLLLVVAMLIAGVYLYVSAQATAAGTRIHQLELQRENLNIRIADLRTQYALHNSSLIMRQRAEELGFRPATQAEIVYMPVPGYGGRSIVFLAPPPSPPVRQTSLLKPAYQQSLWEWLYQGAFQLSESRGARQ